MAISGCIQRGMLPGTWIAATVGLIASQFLTRLITPAEANVNVAWRVPDGWTEVFPHYLTYIVLVDGAAALLFGIIEGSWRALCGERDGCQTPRCLLRRRLDKSRTYSR